MISLEILDISDSITLEEYEEKLKSESNLIEHALSQTKAITDMNIYLCSNEKLNVNDVGLFFVNPQEAIEVQENTEKLNLYKLKIKEGMNIVYNTNIIYYDNFNHTLPIGMNVAHTVTFDMKKYKIELKKQTLKRMQDQFLF